MKKHIAKAVRRIQSAEAHARRRRERGLPPAGDGWFVGNRFMPSVRTAFSDGLPIVVEQEPAQ